MEPTPPAEPLPTITLVEGRRNFREARYEGICFAFLHKTGPNEYKAVQALSGCKDYLNDTVYSEQTGLPCSFYGYDAKKVGIFNEGAAFMAIASLDREEFGVPPRGTEEYRRVLSVGLANARRIINEVEDMLPIKGRTTITPVNDNLLFAVMPLEWVSSTYLTSMWSLVVRNAFYAKSKPALEELVECGQCMEDRMALRNIPAVIAIFKERGLPVQDFAAEAGSIHCYGIYSYMYHRLGLRPAQ